MRNLARLSPWFEYTLDRVREQKLAVKQHLLWSHKTHCKQDQGMKKFSEMKPLIPITRLTESGSKKLAVKQLLLWSHKRSVNKTRAQHKFNEIKPLVPIMLERVREQKVAAKQLHLWSRRITTIAK